MIKKHLNKKKKHFKQDFIKQNQENLLKNKLDIKNILKINQKIYKNKKNMNNFKY